MILKKLGRNVLWCFSNAPLPVKLVLQAQLGEQGALFRGDAGIDANRHLLAMLIDLRGGAAGDGPENIAQRAPAVVHVGIEQPEAQGMHRLVGEHGDQQV